MKKIIFLLAFIVYGLLFAEDSPLVCAGQVPWMNDEFKGELRYFITAKSATNGVLFFGDNKTVEIDKKNKIVKIWNINFQTYKSRDEAIKSLGQHYSTLGYTKSFEVFDITNKKRKILAITQYKCDGSSMYSGDEDSKWEYIVPGSITESKFEIIKKKYGL